jgi:hypothetical protein
MNDRAADYDMFRMKEKPRKIRAGLSRREDWRARVGGAPRLTRLVNAIRSLRSCSFSLAKSSRSSTDKFPKA